MKFINILVLVGCFTYPNLTTASDFQKTDKLEIVFNHFQSMKGKWKIESEGKVLPIDMIYDVGSRNSIVTEQFGKELSVFSMDGSDLLMTHFCNARNQPRLKLIKEGASDQFEFKVFDVLNLKSADSSHVVKVIYRILSPKKVGLELIWKKGKTTESEKYILTKVEL